MSELASGAEPIARLADAFKKVGDAVSPVVESFDRFARAVLGPFYGMEIRDAGMAFEGLVIAQNTVFVGSIPKYDFPLYDAYARKFGIRPMHHDYRKPGMDDLIRALDRGRRGLDG